jgi:hypothetical protein
MHLKILLLSCRLKWSLLMQLMVFWCTKLSFCSLNGGLSDLAGQVAGQGVGGGGDGQDQTNGLSDLAGQVAGQGVGGGGDGQDQTNGLSDLAGQVAGQGVGGGGDGQDQTNGLSDLAGQVAGLNVANGLGQINSSSDRLSDSPRSLLTNTAGNQFNQAENSVPT